MNRSFRWPFHAVTVGLCLIASSGLAQNQEAPNRPLLRLVADSGDSQSRSIAVGMSSLANAKIEALDIDIDWAGFQDDPIELTRRDSSDLALLNLADFDPSLLGSSDDLRAVMKAWKVHDQSDDGQAYLLVAKSSVDSGLIKDFLVAVQSDTIVLKAAKLNVDKLVPSVAMTDLPLRLHGGAEEFLAMPTADTETTTAVAGPEVTDAIEGSGEQYAAISSLHQSADKLPASSAGEPARSDSDQPDQTPLQSRINNARSYVLYFDTNQATIDKEHFRSVARACRYAAKLPRAKFVISGHTDTAGSSAYNDDLAKRRAGAVADAIRNDPRFREALSVVEFGETKPALKTDDGVAEQMNRRVVVTILPD